MNKPRKENKVARSGQHPGASESPESIETFPERTKRPGEVGLANESRPGLGTRSRDERKAAQPPFHAKNNVGEAESGIQPPPTRRPEPEEQDPNSRQHELERDTGVSGHSGGT
jgi:hypothetical protein